MTTPAGMTENHGTNKYEFVEVDERGREHVIERVVVQVNSYDDNRIGAWILDAAQGGEPTGWRVWDDDPAPVEDDEDQVDEMPAGATRRVNANDDPFFSRSPDPEPSVDVADVDPEDQEGAE